MPTIVEQELLSPYAISKMVSARPNAGCAQQPGLTLENVSFKLDTWDAAINIGVQLTPIKTPSYDYLMKSRIDLKREDQLPQVWELTQDLRKLTIHALVEPGPINILLSESEAQKLALVRYQPRLVAELTIKAGGCSLARVSLNDIDDTTSRVFDDRFFATPGDVIANLVALNRGINRARRLGGRELTPPILVDYSSNGHVNGHANGIAKTVPARIG